MTTTTRGSGGWASQEFGSAELGNRLRTMRLVALAAGAFDKPAGLITEVFAASGEREGAYKFAENEKVNTQAICAAACRAAAVRADKMPYVFVPVDGSSLSLPEYEGEAKRGVGSVGTRARHGTGVEVMNAVVIDPLGVPLGLFNQHWWIREGRATVPSQKRKLEEKETRYWFAAMTVGSNEWKKVNPTTRLWFQLDRGGDFREALSWAAESEEWVTIRAAHDRRTADAEQNYLWATLEKTDVQGSMTVELPATKKRKAREATLELRYAPVTLRLRNPWTKTKTFVTLWALLACEKDTPADGSEPVEWMLLTNHTIQSRADAELVLFGYTQRWRIEQFHRTWKSVCRVEETQLRNVSHIERWATVLAAVAMRLLRLTYLSRATPKLPATAELSKAEVFALVIEKGKGIYNPGDEIPLDVATRWIADLGGYVGPKSSGGPPGTTVLARGLRQLTSMTSAIAKVLEFAA
jgi:hypothetical protein